RRAPRLAGVARCSTHLSARREVNLIGLKAGGPQPFLPPEESLVARYEPFPHSEQLSHLPFMLHPARAGLGAKESEAEQTVSEVNDVAGLDLPPPSLQQRPIRLDHRPVTPNPLADAECLDAG